MNGVLRLVIDQSAMFGALLVLVLIALVVFHVIDTKSSRD